jgi:hypothetical protein
MNATTETSARAGVSDAHIVRRLLAVLVLSGVIASLLLAVPSLRGVGTQIADMHVGWVMAAVAFEFGSCVGFVVIFRLFFDELPAGAARELAWVE